MKILRCAIYTRKSSDEGLDQDFNSLDAQREACAAFVASQKHEGWTELPDCYDDGGYSGGNMERPGLKNLLHDIQAKRVDVIVVYKVDRLTRSLADFAKIVEVFDAQGISFVAVTQQFNTTTSMGRLTLNVLLSFAQFEREIAGERIRDKFKASREKGMWMGGGVPLGYEVQDRALVINPTEANKVHLIFDRYLDLRSVNPLAAELEARGIKSHRRTTKDGRWTGGKPLSRGNLYTILRNPVYIGQVVHKGNTYPGLHDPIIDQDIWDKVQVVLTTNRAHNGEHLRSRNPSLLRGLVFDSAGERLLPSHTNKNGVRYRYYISKSYVSGRPSNDQREKRWRIPASELDGAVVQAIYNLLSGQSELPALLGLGQCVPGETAAALLLAKYLAEDLTSEDARQSRSTITRLLNKISIVDETVSISISLNELRDVLGVRCEEGKQESHTIVLPIRITKRGVEKKLIVGAGKESGPNKDQILIKGIARAFKWFEDLKSGEVRNLTELAKRDGVDVSYLRSHLPLAPLAPSIISEILSGRQPPDLTLKRLLYEIDLPITWLDQEQHLGFSG